MSFLEKVGGQIIGGVVGGLFGEEQADDRNAMAIRFRNEDYARQKEFAQHGIQWRVQDAKKAGIHPVFALSGGGAAYASAPVSIADDTVDYMRMGQDIGRSVDAVSSPEARKARELNEREIESRIVRNNAEAAMFDSVRAKNYGQVGPGMPSAILDPNITAVGGTSALAGSGSGQISLKPSESTSYASGDPSLAAASDVMWKLFKIRVGDDGKVQHWWLPNANSVSEAMESVSESLPMQWMVLKENMRRNPYFAEENAHLVPFIDEMKAGADFVHGVQRFGGDFVDQLKKDWSWLPRLVDKFKSGYNYREPSGRERGRNWRSR